MQLNILFVHLRFPVEGHQFAQVVDETRQLEPVLVRVRRSNGLSRLERMVGIWEVNLK